MQKANKKHEELCTAPVTEENVIKKSIVLDRAAEEKGCDEYYGDDDMIYALATQLYNFFGGDMKKAESYYHSVDFDRSIGIYSSSIVDAIIWLNRA